MIRRWSTRTSSGGRWSATRRSRRPGGGRSRRDRRETRRAIDRYLGDLARQGKSKRTLDDYYRKLVPMCGPADGADAPELALITPDDCRAHLDRWRDAAPGTRYHSWAVLSG